MHNLNLDPNCIPNRSCLQESKEASGASDSQPCMSGFSVKTPKSPLPNYVSPSDAVQNNASSVNPSNPRVVAASTSESNFISTSKLKATRARCKQSPADITTQAIQPARDDPYKTKLAQSRNEKIAKRDEYLGTKETASNELISTQQNVPTDTSTSLQGASFGKRPINFSQSFPRPVAIVNPQQKAQTEAKSVKPLLTVSQSNAVQNNASSVNPLNQHAVTASTSDRNFISTFNSVNFPLDELDVYLGTDELDVYLGPKGDNIR